MEGGSILFWRECLTVTFCKNVLQITSDCIVQTAHTSSQTIRMVQQPTHLVISFRILREMFSGHVMSLRSDIGWPQCSPDLTTANFFSGVTSKPSYTNIMPNFRTSWGGNKPGSRYHSTQNDLQDNGKLQREASASTMTDATWEYHF